MRRVAATIAAFLLATAFVLALIAVWATGEDASRWAGTAGICVITAIVLLGAASFP